MDVSLSELREMVMNRDAWRAVVHGVAKSRTRLSDWTELRDTSVCHNWLGPCSGWGLPWWLSGKESACSARDIGPVPGSGRSPGGGHGNSLQYSCLENPMERGACWATVHKVTKSRTQLNWLSMHARICIEQTVENSSRDGNTRPPYLPPEKSVCRSKSNS